MCKYIVINIKISIINMYVKIEKLFDIFIQCFLNFTRNTSHDRFI